MGKSARGSAGLADLCAAAAGASADAADAPGAGASHSDHEEVTEATAFSSVHDMIHAAIDSHGPHATLRQVYQACQERGRIAYKRSGGSRLITQNDHWKSQIRHALYTCDRFQRVSEGADLWQITPYYRQQPPQTVRVALGPEGDAGSRPDPPPAARARGQASGPPQPARRMTRGRAPADADPPFLASTHRRKRSGRPTAASRSPSLAPGGSRGASPPAFGEQLDESSHIDTFTPQPRQGRRSGPPQSGPLDCTVTPSPFPRGAGGDRPWHRAARKLNEALAGSEDEGEATAPGGGAGGSARSAEAESPASTQQALYALRSRARPPPGFGDNPDPAAEAAAREAHASATGPLKKRLKAAAKAAEMAVTAASAAGEEAASARTQHASGPDASCGTPRPPSAWRPPAATACLPPRGRGRGRGMSLIQQVTALPTHAAHLASLSSQEAETGGWAPADGRAAPAPAFGGGGGGGGDAQEGADETDEGGSKRLLRSQAAAAAADLERDGDLDRTDRTPDWA